MATGGPYDEYESFPLWKTVETAIEISEVGNHK